MNPARQRRPPGVPLERPIVTSDLMHATSRRHPFDDASWLYEIKYDGYRCLARNNAGDLHMLSREGHALAPAFPEIARYVSSIRRDVVLDCELTIDDARGHQLFEMLQRRSRMSVPYHVRAAANEYPARLYIFDLLALDGRDLRGLPLLERKRLLRDVFDDSGTLIFVNGIVGLGCAVFEQIVALDLEGMVAKRLDAPYHRGRSRDWLKVKNPSYHRRAALGFGWHRNR